MSIPAPEELVEQFGSLSPEEMADKLGFRIERVPSPPALPGVAVFSEYHPDRTIILYPQALARLAEQRQEPLPCLEQWHIAHELYHALAESHGASPWRIRETAADLWADELMTLAR